MNNGAAYTGRSELKDSELESLLLKVTPFLQRGLSIRDACKEARIPASTVYRKMKEIEWFGNRIESAKNFVKVVYSDIVLRELLRVYQKVQDKNSLTKDDYSFLFWLGEHDKRLSEMFGNHNWEGYYKNLEEVKKEVPVVLHDPKNLKALLEMLEIIKEKGGLDEDNNTDGVSQTYNAL